MARPKMSDADTASRKAEVQARTKATYQATKLLIAAHGDEYQGLLATEMERQGFVPVTVQSFTLAPKAVSKPKSEKVSA